MPAASGRAVGRGVDRRLTVAGIGVAALYLLAAGLSLGLPEGDRRGLWLPLHLAFLGGGGTAIVAVLPYFAASLSAVPAPSPILRGVGIVLVALEIQQAIADGYRCYDFLRGNEPYKYDFGAVDTPLYRILAGRRTDRPAALADCGARGGGLTPPTRGS